MNELSEEDRRILAHLRDRVARGDRYIRAKHIAEHLELTPKQVGIRLSKLAGQTSQVEITKWGRARSTTWRIQPR